MWIFSTIGFFSVVRFPAHANRPSDVMVRSRERSQLEALIARFPALARCPILDQPDSDYRWRIVARQADIADVMAALVDGIDYNNFKGACATEMRSGALSSGYEHALHRIWSVMADTQVTRPYAGRAGGTHAGLGLWDDPRLTAASTVSVRRRRR